MLRVCILAGLFLSVGALAGASEEGCSSCHDQGKRISGTVHAGLGCTGCHSGHETYPHAQKSEKPECADCHAEIVRQHAASVHGQEISKGSAAAPTCTVCHNDVHEIRSARSQEWRRSVPDTCGMCHDRIAAEFKDSVHGTQLAQRTVEAPTCTDCHGEHAIQRPSNPRSPVHVSHIRATCASCHADVRLGRKFGLPLDRVVSFDESFHGLALKAGNQTVANCASCHGFHNIRPSSDPKSMIHPAHLQKTCGQAQCHPGVTSSRFAIGRVHWTEGEGEPRPVRLVRRIYLLLIPLIIGPMILHNAGDWLRKLRRLRFQAPAPAVPAETRGAPPLRMYGFERLEHGLLLGSFLILLWSGFALKYPETWWALPLAAWERQWPVRGTLHRAASVVFLGVALLHLISLAASPRLRRHWTSLLPKWRDVTDAASSFAYNLGLSGKPPRLPAYNFIEKVEYWAVVWGAILMAVTGIVLWANSFSLHYIPKVWLDVATAIHFYEAILAGLAILVWHIYFVILDPEVYPAETTWITGRSVRRQGSASEPEAIGQ
ncbi:MAG: cytochrome b/b6 domain-containing protein [Acidobacteria bacterium]|nr:cytochrome b/b6 domain-containing protein [Acidobacteriota bacterium]MBI3281707.1 cytochrome b/b6 domain-containing protein [Acidobacteriota bacterium]